MMKQYSNHLEVLRQGEPSRVCRRRFIFVWAAPDSVDNSALLCSVITISLETTAELDDSFIRDCEAAEPYQLDEWRSRNVLLKLQEFLSRLIIDQL